MMLNDVIGPCEILVPSDDIARDRRQWPDAVRFGVRFVKAYVPPYTRFWTHLQRIPLGLLKMRGWPYPFPRWLKEQIKSVAAVIASSEARRVGNEGVERVRSRGSPW